MKKILSAALCVGLLVGTVSATAISASAAETNEQAAQATVQTEASGYETFTSGGFTFESGVFFNEDGITLRGFDEEVYSLYNPDYKTSHILKIPDYVEGKPVTEINFVNNGAYYSVSKESPSTFRTVIIPKTVKQIIHGFESRESLEYVKFEEGSELTNIGASGYGTSGGFTNCTNLKRIGVGNTDKLPNNTKIIYEETFYNCTSLSSITLPDNLEQIGFSIIGKGAFESCTSLKKISIPATIKTIERGSFYNCTNLEAVVFETYKTGENRGKSSLSYLWGGYYDKGTFQGCTNLKSVELPLSIKDYSIPEHCFENTGLTGIDIPESITKIGTDAFKNTKLTNSLSTDKGEKYAIGFFNKKVTLTEYNGDIFGDTYQNTPNSEKPIIAGFSNSSANDFALKNGHTFVSVGDWNPFNNIFFNTIGDLDDDGPLLTVF